jgi:hypothetical protein
MNALSKRIFSGCVAGMLLSATQAGDLSSTPFDNARDVYNFFDRDGNDQLNKEERDFLQLAYQTRRDLAFIDQDRNGKISEAEVLLLEARYHKEKETQASRQKKSEEKRDKKNDKKGKKDGDKKDGKKKKN